MPTAIDRFASELIQDIHQNADAEGQYLEASFFELFCNHLVEAGEIDEYTYSPYGATRGVRVDGYDGDPGIDGELLTLIISDLNQSDEILTITRTDIDAIFRRLEGFVKRSMESEFIGAIEDNQDAFDLAQIIRSRIRTIKRLKFVLITNKQLSARVDGFQAAAIFDAQVSYNVWDVSRLFRFVVAGQGREEIEIDLESDVAPPLPALSANIPGTDYTSYLVAMPGRQLAQIYDQWTTRLLEQNVRVFLQARGKVNQGIRNTINLTPELFFAFNNGITATAEEVETRNTGDGLEIVSMKNFQIVNGGQTTASIHASFLKDASSVDNVFVQMKLSVVERAKALELVPKISEFANTQNKVNAADFFANHPFHVRMESFSLRIGAPSPNGAVRETKWFYERARGQYQNQRALQLVESKRKKFDQEFPKGQLIDKTGLAKYLQVWDEKPHIVSKGAQKNFVDFAEWIAKEWEAREADFNERFFRHMVARAIIFRATEKLVTAQPWYEGGYRANIVAHGVSRLVYEAKKRKSTINLDQVWRQQAVGKSLELALIASCKAANEVILSPDAGVRNFSEWAKQQACWARVQRQQVNWPAAWLDELQSGDDARSEKAQARKVQRELSGIEAQSKVCGLEGQFWKSVLDWGQAKQLLSGDETGMFMVALALPYKIPTEAQSVRILKALKRLQEEGCPLGRGVLD